MLRGKENQDIPKLNICAGISQTPALNLGFSCFFCFSGGLKSFCFAEKHSKTLCGSLLWAAQIQSCTRQLRFLCNAAVCISAFPFLINALFLQPLATEKTTWNLFSASSGKQPLCGACFLMYLKT